MSASRTKLAVGQVWRRRDGSLITITKQMAAYGLFKSSDSYYYVDDYEIKYFISHNRPHNNDLMKPIYVPATLKTHSESYAC